jgi:tetratricopeptide (TPR) repeat protein
MHPLFHHPLARVAVVAVFGMLGAWPQTTPLAIREALSLAQQAQSAVPAQPAVAANALDDVAARLPYDAYFAYVAGQAALAAGTTDEAVALLTRAGALSAQGPAYFTALGDAYQAQGDLARAVEAWQTAAADQPGDLGLVARLAGGYEKTGRLAEARDAYAQLTDNGHAEPLIVYRLGLLTAVTAPAEAPARLQVAIDQGAPYAAPASQILTAVKEGETNDDPAYGLALVGIQLIQLQEWDLAAQALSASVSANPAYAEAHAYLGLAQDARGIDGRESFEQAMTLAPQSALVNFLYGLHYRNQGQSQQALPYLQRAQQADPGNPAIAAEMGGAYAALGDLDAAEGWFRTAVNNDRANPQFWLLLARFYIDRNYLVAEHGLAAAQQAVTLNPDEPLAADALGYALVLTGDLDAGRAELDRALRLDPELAAAHYHLGVFYMVRSDTDSAQTALDRALALDPQGPYGDLAIKAMATLGVTP